jgi:peptide/nickel transport system permease protein
MIVVVAGVTVVVFVMMRVLPGDPCRTIHGDRAPQHIIKQCREDYGFDQPIWVQYIEYMRQLATGDLGESLYFHRPAMELLLERIPVTLFLVLYGTTLSIILAVPLGIWAALKQDGLPDRLMQLGTTVALSMPAFWTGTLLMLVFSIGLDWFPVGGYGQTAMEHLYHLFLPALTMAVSIAAMLARDLRSSIIDAMSADYVRTANAKGLARRAVFLRHVLRNSLVSTVTLLGLNLAYAMGGTVLVEVVFAIPGVGTLLISSILARDYSVVQNTTVMFALLVLAVTFLTDLVYPLLDPRVRYG